MREDLILCETCGEILRNYIEELFAGSCAHRPLFCAPCEKAYCTDAFETFIEEIRDTRDA